MIVARVIFVVVTVGAVSAQSFRFEHHDITTKTNGTNDSDIWPPGKSFAPLFFPCKAFDTIMTDLPIIAHPSKRLWQLYQ